MGPPRDGVEEGDDGAGIGGDVGADIGGHVHVFEHSGETWPVGQG